MMWRLPSTISYNTQFSQLFSVVFGIKGPFSSSLIALGCDSRTLVLNPAHADSLGGTTGEAERCTAHMPPSPCPQGRVNRQQAAKDRGKQWEYFKAVVFWMKIYHTT